MFKSHLLNKTEVFKPFNLHWLKIKQLIQKRKGNMTKNIQFAFVTLLLSLFVSVPTASAHRPADGEEGVVTQIPNTSTSFVYYRAIPCE